jgi:hypothetical protein
VAALYELLCVGEVSRGAEAIVEPAHELDLPSVQTAGLVKSPDTRRESLGLTGPDGEVAQAADEDGCPRSG